MKKVVWVAGSVAIAALAVGLFLLRRASNPGLDAYVNPQQCGACHPDVAAKFRTSGMARSFTAFRPDHTEADFERNNVFIHAASGRKYTMLRRGETAVMRRHQLGEDGSEENVVEKRIDYILGSGHKAQTFLHRNGRGELIELPVAWYTEKGGFWAMNPGFDRPDHDGFRRRIRYDCLFCHNAYPDLGGADDSFYANAIYPARLPQGIDCQRCHGPGAAHVERASRGAGGSKLRESILNPARLSRERQMEVCMQCHLQTTSRSLPYAIIRLERGVFSFRPQQPLSSYILHFDHAPGKGFDDKFEIAHAAYRLRQSACFERSDSMTCTTCHDPHAAETVKGVTHVCRSCHAGSLAPSHPKEGDCAGCHMPQRRTEDVVHVVMTDHRIRRPGLTNPVAPLSEHRETAETAYRGPVVPYYPKQGIGEVYVALAQVRAGSNLDAGIPQLENALERMRPARAEFYYELAEAYWKAGNAERAFENHERALRLNPRFLPALRSYGMELSASSRPEKGEEVLKRALELDPADARTLHDLGLNYASRQKRELAIEMFRRALTSDPESPETQNALAAELYASGDRTGAKAAFREAIRAKPDYTMAHANLAILLAYEGENAGAERHFRKAVLLDPRYAKARLDYGLFLAAGRRLEEAARELRAAIQLKPGDPQALAALSAVLGAMR